MAGYHIIIRRHFPEYVDLEELLEITGITPGLLNYFLEFGLVEAVKSSTGALRFEIGMIPRIRMIQRLRADIGVNLPGIAIILNLQDRIQQLQQMLNGQS